MIKLPDPNKTFFYEDNFLLSCKPSRLAKILSLYEAYKMAELVPGIFVECGVFKGASFSIFSMLRFLLEDADIRRLVAFDTFSHFAKTENPANQKHLQEIEEKAGLNCISVGQLYKTLEMRECGLEKNIDLISGDICETVPRYIDQYPNLQISLLSIDVDFEEATRTILEYLFPKVAVGGIVLIDDYDVFEGEKRAVDDYFSDSDYILKRCYFSKHPWYLVKK